MGGKSQPAPDYTGAAEKQGQSSKENIAMQTWANRPQLNTPWGSQTWGATGGYDPSSGTPVTQWTSNINLTPEQQSALDAQQRIQQGRSGAAETLLGQATGSFQTPFNWGALPQLAGTPQAQQTSAEALQRGVSPTGQQTGLQQYERQTSIPQYGQQTGVQQYGLDTSAPGQTTFAGNEPGFAGERQRIEQALFERMQPEHARQEEASRARLANMGMTMGSTAYNRELERLGGLQAGERFNALQTAGSEQQRLNQMLLANQGQAFGQDVQSQQAQNAALGQQFGQGLQAGQFTNQALQNLFGQGQAAGQFANQAAESQFNQGLQAGQFGNQANQTLFGQNLAAAQFGNQAGQQAFNQNLAANQQNFSQQLQAAQYQDQARQQAIAEEAQRRGMSLNELNALLTQQQVGMPQMPNFTPAGAAPATPYLGAAQAQGQANQADSGGSGIGTLLGGVAGSFFGPLGTAAGSALGGALVK
jgi:hypothetical protein